MTERTMMYASLPERFLSVLMDYVIICIAFVTLVMLLAGDGSNPIQLKFWHVFAVEWMYFSSQHSSKRRATLGMRVMKLQIVTMDKNQLNLQTASLRYIVSIVSSLMLWLGHFLMLTNDLRQTMHDKVAKTLVIKAEL